MPLSRSLRGFVSGRVQGVGFRYFVMRHARAESLQGYVRNLADGRVEFHLQGESAAVARVLDFIRRGPDYSRVEAVSVDEVAAIAAGPEFAIRR